MKQINTQGITGEFRRTKLRHYPIKKGTKILFADGTKIIRPDGLPYIVPVSYCIDLAYDSPASEEYVFWNRNRVKKVNVMACQSIF